MNTKRFSTIYRLPFQSLVALFGFCLPDVTSKNKNICRNTNNYVVNLGQITTSAMLLILLTGCNSGNSPNEVVNDVTETATVASDNGTETETNTNIDSDTSDTSSEDSSDDTPNQTTGLQPVTSLVHDNLTREYLVYLPAGSTAAVNLPVFLNFHGYGDSAQQHFSYTDMRELAEQQNIILVYPQGSLLGSDPHWNPSASGGDNKSTTDDYGFISALIKQLYDDYGVDRQRVYAMGYSNGGMMAYGLACQPTRLVAAAVSVSGAMLDDVLSGCAPEYPMPVLNIHGTSDGVVPYNGGTGYASVDESLSYWQNFNQTDVNATQTSDTDNGQLIEYVEYSSGSKGSVVAHYKVNNGGHIWFDFLFEGQSTNQLIWAFVSPHSVGSD
jgi:polyhydroxybutyrate depolymerase